ncbi:MAG: hypothetical protein AMXMBFR7_00590 [Planctomycetota bacterium]
MRRIAAILLPLALLAGCSQKRPTHLYQGAPGFPLLEENAVRFKAKLLAVEPVGSTDKVLTATDSDPRYCVSAQLVELGDGQKAPFKVGDVKHFAVHDVDALFGGAGRAIEGHVYNCTIQYQIAKNGRWRLRDLKIEP